MVHLNQRLCAYLHGFVQWKVTLSTSKFSHLILAIWAILSTDNTSTGSPSQLIFVALCARDKLFTHVGVDLLLDVGRRPRREGGAQLEEGVGGVLHYSHHFYQNTHTEIDSRFRRILELMNHAKKVATYRQYVFL